MKRRICWPNPDRVCMEGGCLYCDGYPLRSAREIERCARQKDLMASFRYSLNAPGVEWVLR